MTRRLATIRRIAKLSPIDGADRIEVASIDGWKVVTQKGIHQEGDLVVYFEIDSLLPEIEQFEFLRKGSYVKTSQEGAGFRLKTIKLRKQVSQGLIVPIRELFEDNTDGTFSYFQMGDFLIGDSLMGDEEPVVISEEEAVWQIPLREFVLTPEEGDDVTEILGVKKYEKIIPAQLAGKVRGNFPSFIPKTDQERIQNFIGHFRRDHQDHEWEVSLKLDGSSMTAYYYAPEDRFGVCSRNMDLTETEDNAYWAVARKLNLEKWLRDACGDEGSMAIQGELMGPGIQGNRENLLEHDLYVYDMWDIVNYQYVPAGARQAMTEAMNLRHCPVYSIESFAYDSASDFLQLAEFGYGDGKSINNPVREGLVFKSTRDPSVSFKAISDKFLLSGGDD